MSDSCELDTPQVQKTPSSPARGPYYAALDLGTNNCRLLIAGHLNPGNPRKPALGIIDSYSRIVRLGEGLGKDGALSADAIERTIKALETCKSKLAKYPIKKARFVATEACRRASNNKDFLRRVQQEVGLKLEIISTEEEARLAFFGCSSLLDDSSTHALTFDIGGGSTEFMWVERNQGHTPKVLGWNSIPYGVMNLSEQFGNTSYAELYFEEIVERLMNRLGEFDSKHGIRNTIDSRDVQLLSTSGTVTTLAAIYMDLERYDRSRIDGINIPVDHLRQAIQKLLKMNPGSRYQHPCIGSQRADYIISGCAILEAIHRTWPIANITIADRGVREGIIIDMLHKQADEGGKA